MKDIGFIMLNSSKNILLIALFTAAFVWSCSDSNSVNEFGNEDYGEVTFTISGDVEGSFSWVLFSITTHPAVMGIFIMN